MFGVLENARFSVISEFGIIQVDTEKGIRDEIYNYQKRKFALRKIKELYKRNGINKVYYLCWHDFIDNETHCEMIGRRGKITNSNYYSLGCNYQKGVEPIRKKYDSNY